MVTRNIILSTLSLSKGASAKNLEKKGGTTDREHEIFASP